jgi:ribosomal-protein-alanine N-acetyltransferase
MDMEQVSFDEDTREDSVLNMKRLTDFPEGCFILEHSESEGSVIPSGCFLSELWDLPEVLSEDIFDENDESLWKHNPEGRDLYISSVAVAPEFRGQGAGAFLFNESLSIISGKFSQIKRFFLIVCEEWTAARAMYKRAGFEEIYTLKEFYGGGVTAPKSGIVMVRPI